MTDEELQVIIKKYDLDKNGTFNEVRVVLRGEPAQLLPMPRPSPLLRLALSSAATMAATP